MIRHYHAGSRAPLGSVYAVDSNVRLDRVTPARQASCILGPRGVKRYTRSIQRIRLEYQPIPQLVAGALVEGASVVTIQSPRVEVNAEPAATLARSYLPFLFD